MVALTEAQKKFIKVHWINQLMEMPEDQLILERKGDIVRVKPQPTGKVHSHAYTEFCIREADATKVTADSDSYVRTVCFSLGEGKNITLPTNLSIDGIESVPQHRRKRAVINMLQCSLIYAISEYQAEQAALSERPVLAVVEPVTKVSAPTPDSVVTGALSQAFRHRPDVLADKAAKPMPVRPAYMWRHPR